MAHRNLHVVHLLVRNNLPGGQVGFLLDPHEHWNDPGGQPYLALPAKKTVKDPLAEFILGTPLDVYIDSIACDDWKLPTGAYDVDQEFDEVDDEMEIWSKPYYERGTSAWSHRILKAGDRLEVDALQCDIVHWLGAGKGVVFKAGPGPLAEVGKLGVKGKTPCTECPCMKPEAVIQLERSKT